MTLQLLNFQLKTSPAITWSVAAKKQASNVPRITKTKLNSKIRNLKFCGLSKSYQKHLEPRMTALLKELTLSFNPILFLMLTFAVGLF